MKRAMNPEKHVMATIAAASQKRFCQSLMSYYL